MQTTDEGARPGSPILTVSDVEVAYGAIQAIRGVSIDVQAGSIVAILGANGAGKTSLLRAVSGLLLYHNGRVPNGSITFQGADITTADASDRVKSGMAQVMEGRRIFAQLTVDENLQTGAYSRRDKAGVRTSYDEVMAMFPRLAERRKQVAGYMSGGEQQMLAIGRALMAKPKLLLLDEPSLGLAPLIVQQIFEIISDINKRGTSVLIVEQNAAMALRIADYAYVFESGRVALSGNGKTMLDDPNIQSLYLGGEAHEVSFQDLKSYRRKGQNA